jgi:AcrR family transcriptional regulator
MASRQYSSTLRAAQAQLSRERIAAAATELFSEKGYAATTIGAVAERSGVSLQTVYNAVGGKPALLALAYTWSLHGQTEPPVVTETDEFRDMFAATTAAEAMTRYAGIARQYTRRSGAVASIVFGERGTPEVRKLARLIERQRLRGSERLVQLVHDRFDALRPDLTVKTAAERLWVITAPEAADRLVIDRGWTWEQYERWLAEYMTTMLLR